MNLIYLSLLFIIGLWLWKKSGVKVFTKTSLVALIALFAIWWFAWGQVAVADGWWIYNGKNILGFRIGFVPVVDLLYFFAGIGWHLYFAKKLKIV
jgi:lycopene cyclase domain-containing protein